jgi:hypothetical protein
MSVVEFPLKWSRQDGWSASEFRQVIAGVAPSVESGEAGGWDVGTTEAGDPQFYLLGPAPDHDCVLCISRLGSLYVVEDGAGEIVSEHVSLRALAEAVGSFLRARKAAIVARVALIWYAAREIFEEKVDAMLGESEDLLVHFGPQLAMLG